MSKVNYFLCRVCGECCSGEMKVFLNPHDITLLLAYFAQKGETLSEEELFNKRYLVRDRKNGHLLPRLNFKKVSGIKFCPFLENRLEEEGNLIGLCKLHPDFKPLVCHLAPLTREVDFATEQESFGFVPPYPSCPGCRLTENEKTDANIAGYDRLSSDLKKRLEDEKKYFRELWNQAR